MEDIIDEADTFQTQLVLWSLGCRRHERRFGCTCDKGSPWHLRKPQDVICATSLAYINLKAAETHAEKDRKEPVADKGMRPLRTTICMAAKMAERLG